MRLSSRFCLFREAKLAKNSPVRRLSSLNSFFLEPENLIIAPVLRKRAKRSERSARGLVIRKTGTCVTDVGNTGYTTSSVFFDMLNY